MAGVGLLGGPGPMRADIGRVEKAKDAVNPLLSCSPPTSGGETHHGLHR